MILYHISAKKNSVLAEFTFPSVFHPNQNDSVKKVSLLTSVRPTCHLPGNPSDISAFVPVTVAVAALELHQIPY